MRSFSKFLGTSFPVSHRSQGGKTLWFRKRQIIFSAGDHSDGVFFIESGAAKLTLTSPKGREAVVGVLHEGDFFGEDALDDSRPLRSTSAIALTDLRAVRIGRDAMLLLLRTEQNVTRAFVSYLIRSIAALTVNMGDHLLYGGEQRLARALLAVAQPGTDRSKAMPKFTQQDLADMIGITRQRVNALMSRFRRLGLVDYADGLRIHSSLRNAAQKRYRVS
jgi:CRP/FNR family transcriptional regulator, cyclic AMP receptor protein